MGIITSSKISAGRGEWLFKYTSASYPFEAVVILPGEDRVEALPGDLQHGEAAARGCLLAVDANRHVGDLVQRLRSAVVVHDHVVVDRPGFRGAAIAAVVPRRSELGVLEQRGDAVEVAGVDPERVFVDQRGDLVDITRTAAHAAAPARIGIEAHPRTLPECTRVHRDSSIS